MKHHIDVMISKQEISKRITELGDSITKYFYNSKNGLILVGLLRGSFIFIADLCRSISIDHKIDFMTISSYGRSSVIKHDVKIIKDLNEDISGKDVLIVEDIIDSGDTIYEIYKILMLKNPHSLSICAFLSKSENNQRKIKPRWIGFNISNEFVVGYGMDYIQMYRNLPYIGKIIPNPFFI